MIFLYKKETSINLRLGWIIYYNKFNFHGNSILSSIANRYLLINFYDEIRKTLLCSQNLRNYSLLIINNFIEFKSCTVIISHYKFIINYQLYFNQYCFHLGMTFYLWLRNSATEALIIFFRKEKMHTIFVLFFYYMLKWWIK